ncbi:hypothetical protein QZH41_014350 [Actinostola sp. cb2023]|nr:hypothetical protein QZH41_014350 [Actinostola sp. cb2023]
MVIYNGHKRVHALMFQCVALPNGLIGNLYGPVEGRKHDAGMLADSGLLNDICYLQIHHWGIHSVCMVTLPSLSESIYRHHSETEYQPLR